MGVFSTEMLDGDGHTLFLSILDFSYFTNDQAEKWSCYIQEHGDE